MLSPWCNRNGWLDVKHQITYFDATLLWFSCKCIIIVEIIAWLYEWGMSCCCWNNMILWWCWWMFLWCCLFFLEHISIGSKFRHSSNKLNYAGELCPFCSLLPPLVCWPGLERNDSVLVWMKSCTVSLTHSAFAVVRILVDWSFIFSFLVFFVFLFILLHLYFLFPSMCCEGGCLKQLQSTSLVYSLHSLDRLQFKRMDEVFKCASVLFI